MVPRGSGSWLVLFCYGTAIIFFFIIISGFIVMTDGPCYALTTCRRSPLGKGETSLLGNSESTHCSALLFHC
ncbi:hypothetical protein DM02DRAFT_141177 [Periconia macrospinosa]|uniref:Uncharacterized protein n=1 Tax=Periconia macrospinosa TaxID=97972 RepID=A0A2V1DCB1_9PLEO|nr:hypothetical protein DM02DRAFT_141177 [Periconia macrospinosa]